MTKTKKRSKVDFTVNNKKKTIKMSSLKGLQKIRENVAGIDVGGEYHFVAAPDPKYQNKIMVNRFGCFTSNLEECVNWLKECNIVSVAMEATGVYWKCLYAMLVKAGIEVIVANPSYFKKMKDKKTDVCDAEFLQLYHSYGLIEGSVILDGKMEGLRTFTRMREQAVGDVAKSIQRMQKALINMNLRLDNVINDISGVTGMTIIRAIINGQRDPKELAKFRDTRCKKSKKEIEESLYGVYQDHYVVALKEAVAEYDFHHSRIQRCDQQIETKLKEFETHPQYNALEGKDKPIVRRKSKQKRTHEFYFDLKEEIIRITGLDLTDLPAFGASTALMMIAETGIDMSKWKTYKHFASWLGISANNKVSGGKILQSRTKHKKKKAGLMLRMSVSGLYRDVNDTAIGAFFRRKKAQLGAPKAITAAANKLARMYYMTLSTGKPFVEMGAQGYYALQKEKYMRRVRKQVAQWGYELTPIKKNEEFIITS